MNIFDAAKDKLNQLANSDPERAEQLSDQVLDKAEQLASERTGGQHAEHIQQAREAVDERVGLADHGEAAEVAVEEAEGGAQDPEGAHGT